jgi:hypothetical protein
VVGTYAIKRSSYEKLVLHGPRWLYRVLRENTHCDARLLPCDPPDEDVMEAAYALWTPHDKESPYCSLGEAISATHEILGYRTAAM